MIVEKPVAMETRGFPKPLTQTPSDVSINGDTMAWEYICKAHHKR